MYPANSVAVLPPEWFKDKVVLIGAVLSITDRHQTPYAVVDQGGEDGMMPGIMIHAHSLSQIIDGRPEPQFSPTWSKAIILFAALLGVLICIFKKGIVFNVIVGMVVVIAWWLGVMLGHSYGLPLIPLVAPTLSLALSIWMMDMLIGRAERKQRQFVQGAFSRYVSPAVVGQLVDNPEALSISGVKREATFIFTDIAGFTTLSEKLTSEKLSEVLNEYLDGACQIILRYEGTVDKFIGDAIMCIFNAPLEQLDHAERAVKCALELDEYAEAFRQRQNALDIPIGVTRIGVHTGIATIGNFGSTSRMDFTALGDTVNTAARTEGVNKYFGTRVCCTEETVKRVPQLHFKKIGDVVLKGKIESVGLFNPIKETEVTQEPYLDYQKMYTKLESGSSDGADSVKQLALKYPEDSLIQFHLERVLNGSVTTLVHMEDK
jgi:class 3 adenylate cyclase